MDPILQKFRDKFLEEAVGLLDSFEKDILELEKNPSLQQNIESAFRAMHTIKGASGMYGFDFVCEFTHHLESVFQLVREHKLSFTHELFELAFQAIDHLRKLLNDERLADLANLSTHHQLMAQVEKMACVTDQPDLSTSTQPEVVASASSVHTWHILFQTDEKIYFRGISVLGLLRDLAQLGRFQVSRLDFLSDAQTDMWSILVSSNHDESDIREVFMFVEEYCTFTPLTDKDVFDENTTGLVTSTDDSLQNDVSILDYIERNTQDSLTNSDKCCERKSANVAAKQKVRRISVDSIKLDHLMYLVSELITVNSQLSLATKDAAYNTLKPIIERVDALSKQFRNNALEIRLVPLSDTLLRFQRLIRDLSKQLNKKIELVTEGVDTELDKSTIDQLSDPLMHIIRNCIDHGIEMPDLRLSKGKPETGSIKITACHSGNYVLIKIEDDGSGIDCEKVRLKAVERGLLKADDKPSRSELFDLIFLPGFSTAQSLTEVSGRGVGMDVVKRKITDLRGDVIVDSIEGAGTSFTLKLQQSVTIIDTLLFCVGNTYLTLPVNEIDLCVQETVANIDKRRHNGTLAYNNQLIPFIDLRELFCLSGKYEGKVKVIVVKNADKHLALLADIIVGEHQAVLKPLGKSFNNQPYIASASQLGDGNLAFMLDTHRLQAAYDTIVG